LGPDGVELITPDLDDDVAPGGFGADAQARFMALSTGTYTIIASGGGGTGQYRLFLDTPACPAVPLPIIPPDGPWQCANPGLGAPGPLSGTPLATSGPAPLPIPGISDDVPNPTSPAALYTFTAQPGDVISVEMDSDDDAHLFLLGP